MNCVCDCEYCYLKGMYDSANLVVFVNIEDYFKNISGKKYICVSYDTDLFPLESLLGYVEKWNNFANESITIEIRTKCKNLDIWNMQVNNNTIFAFSLSPDEIIQKYEHKTSSLNARLENIEAAYESGFRCRACIDPIIYTKDYKNIYKNLIDEINFDYFEDVSIGSFRISQQYLKKMRKNSQSKLVNFPFKNINGYFQYDEKIRKEMENYIYGLVVKKINKDKVFLW